LAQYLLLNGALAPSFSLAAVKPNYSSILPSQLSKQPPEGLAVAVVDLVEP